MVDCSPFDLTRQKTIVSGAGHGIGPERAIARVPIGAGIAITARDAASLAECDGAIGKRGPRVVSLSLDVLDVAQIETTVNSAADWLGGLCVRVNTASVEEVKPPLEMTEAIRDKVFDTNACAQSSAAAPPPRQWRCRRRKLWLSSTARLGHKSVS